MDKEEEAPSPAPAPSNIVMAEDFPDIDMKIRESEFKMKGENIKLKNRIEKLERDVKLCCPDYDKQAKKIQSRLRGNKERKEVTETHYDPRYKTKGLIIIVPNLSYKSGEKHDMSVMRLGDKPGNSGVRFEDMIQSLGASDILNEYYDKPIGPDQRITSPPKLILYNFTNHPVWLSHYKYKYTSPHKTQHNQGGNKLLDIKGSIPIEYEKTRIITNQFLAISSDNIQSNYYRISDNNTPIKSDNFYGVDEWHPGNPGHYNFPFKATDGSIQFFVSEINSDSPNIPFQFGEIRAAGGLILKALSRTPMGKFTRYSNTVYGITDENTHIINPNTPLVDFIDVIRNKTLKAFYENKADRAMIEKLEGKKAGKRQKKRRKTIKKKHTKKRMKSKKKKSKRRKNTKQRQNTKQRHKYKV